MKALKVLALILFVLIAATEATQAATKQSGVTVRIIDPSMVKILTVETDLTPTLTFDIPGQPRQVVNAWGWAYPEKESCWNSNGKVNVFPFGALVEGNQISGWNWDGLGIPQDLQTWTVQTDTPPEPPDFVNSPETWRASQAFDQKLQTQGVHIFNIVDNRVVRALVWIYQRSDQTCTRTYQVAVGELVPAGVQYTDRTLPNTTAKPPTSATLKVADVFLTRSSSQTASNGITTSVWDTKVWSWNDGYGNIYNFRAGIFRMAELNPSLPGEYYSKYDFWNPARIIGLPVCYATRMYRSTPDLTSWFGLTEWGICSKAS